MYARADKLAGKGGSTFPPKALLLLYSNLSLMQQLETPEPLLHCRYRIPSITMPPPPRSNALCRAHRACGSSLTCARSHHPDGSHCQEHRGFSSLKGTSSGCAAIQRAQALPNATHPRSVKLPASLVSIRAPALICSALLRSVTTSSLKVSTCMITIHKHLLNKEPCQPRRELGMASRTRRSANVLKRPWDGRSLPVHDVASNGLTSAMGATT